MGKLCDILIRSSASVWTTFWGLGGRVLLLVPLHPSQSQSDIPMNCNRCLYQLGYCILLWCIIFIWLRHSEICGEPVTCPELTLGAQAQPVDRHDHN